MGVADNKVPAYQEPTALAEKDVAKVEMDDVPVDDIVKDFSENRDYNDQMDMKRLGKEQLFKVSAVAASLTKSSSLTAGQRNFSFVSTLGFISVYMASWELVILVLSGSVASGGYSGLLWGFIVTSLLYAPVVLSLAEMESMAPTSGGQYHWVSEFAPPKYQKYLSYASGWMLTLSWLATQTAGPFLTVTLINTLINVTNSDYAFTSWQYTLIMLAVVGTTILFNTWAATILPTLEAFALYVHVLGFFIVIISLWVCGPKGTAEEVFITFTAENGWNLGAALLVTQVNSFYCILGSDTAVHISEEIQNAGTVVPRCMWWSYVLNFVMALGKSLS